MNLTFDGERRNMRKRRSQTVSGYLYLASGRRARLTASRSAYRRSSWQPTRMTGVRGQKCLISRYHMVFTWWRELGLAMEKHSTTTSDLQGDNGRKRRSSSLTLPSPGLGRARCKHGQGQRLRHAKITSTGVKHHRRQAVSARKHYGPKEPHIHAQFPHYQCQPEGLPHWPLKTWRKDCLVHTRLWDGLTALVESPPPPHRQCFFRLPRWGSLPR